MKKYLLWISIFYMSCQNIEKNKSQPIIKQTLTDNVNSSKEWSLETSKIDSILEEIYNLKKVKELGKISILVQEPTEIDSSYDFKVGYNLPERFQTVYNYRFTKGSKSILFYDVENDKYVEILKSKTN